MTRRMLLSLGLTLAVIVVAALDSGIYSGRIDLTANRIYTLSPATRDLFRAIPQTLQLTYYVSDKLRKISPVPQQLEDLLGEYGAASGGKIRVRSVDPQRAGLTEQLGRIGILPEQMQIIEQNERTSALVYSGVDVQYLNRHEVLGFVGSVDAFEYALDVAISKALGASSWSAAVLVGDRGRTIQRDYSVIVQAVGRYYDVTPIDRGEAVPPGTRVLIVLGGRDLSTADLRPVDEFVASGGAVLFCVPGVAIDIAGDLHATPDGELPLNALIAQYGVKIAPSLVLDTSIKHFRTLVQSGGQYVWQDLGPYPFWVALRASDVSTTSPITRGFVGLDLLWPSPLVGLGSPGVQYEAILRSTPDAWIMRAPFDTNPNDVASYGTSGSQQPGQYVLGYALVGRFQGGLAGQSAPAARPSRMIVIGDDAFASNLMQYSDSLYNVDFLQNAVDWLAGNDAFLSIRAKGRWDPRLDRIVDPGAKQAVFRFAEVVNIVVIPLVVLLIGMRRAFIRRGRRGAAR